MTTSSHVCIVIALPSEAQPLIEAFELEKVEKEDSIYPVYAASDESMWLTISGMGKIHSGAAVAYLQAISSASKNSVWLNIGTAGAQSHHISEAFLTNKITDAATRRSWYPPMVVKSSRRSESIFTVDVASQTYPETGLVDMEAAGFYAVASTIATSELIQCLKIVSDNVMSKPVRHWPQHATSLIEKNIDCVRALVISLQDLSDELSLRAAMPPFYDEFISRWHLTVSQKTILRRLLRRWHVVCPDQSPLEIGDVRPSNTKQAIRVIQATLADVPCKLGPP